MKANHSKIWLTFSLLLAMGCGARTPLDDWETPVSPGAGGATSQSGGASARLGGSLAPGGQGGGGRGGQTATAGPGGTGGLSPGLDGGQVASGGSLATGATIPSGGSIVGGRGGSGGTPPAGGTGAGGRTRGTGGTTPSGGTLVGGGGGSTGTPPLGGTVVGGRTGRNGGQGAASGGAGGIPPLGGTGVGGRTRGTGGQVASGGAGGTPPLGGTVVGGRGGTAGSSAAGGTGAAGSGGTAGTAGSSAAGGTGAAGSGGTAGTLSCPLSFSPGETPIDDMNDGDRFIPQVDGRSGAWSDSSVGATGATMFPDPAGPFTMTPTGDGCPGYSAYVRGGPFVDQGVFFSFGLGSPYNASAYTGFSFWAKIDSGTSPGLRVAFPDKDTQPDGALCQPAVAGSNFCYDHYGKRLILTTGWTKYTIYFNSVTQDGWGRQGAGFDPSTIYGVQFQLSVNATFAIWIDDVAFTTSAPP